MPGSVVLRQVSCSKCTFDLSAPTIFAVAFLLMLRERGKSATIVLALVVPVNNWGVSK